MQLLRLLYFRDVLRSHQRFILAGEPRRGTMPAWRSACGSWTAVTKHRTPWVLIGKAPAFDDDRWELYDTRTDWSQAHDLSAEHPDLLRELQRLWLIEAVKYNVLPLDDRGTERFVPEIAGRPTLIRGTRQLLFRGMGRLTEYSVLTVKNKSHVITAELDVSASGAEGVIVAQGGARWTTGSLPAVVRHPRCGVG
jgi:hypothetical protein